MWRFAGVTEWLKTELQNKARSCQLDGMHHEGTAKLTRLSAGFYFALVTSDTGRRD
jgi:hypothetical protein